MKTICVNASHQYDVMIGSGVLSHLGDLLSERYKGTTTVIVSDHNVYKLYGEQATKSLEAAGHRVLHFVFPAGEAHKTIQTYGEIVEFLAKNHVTRSDILIALGGGVTGDMAGFAAATYLRGIPYVQIPTSLLAMVDSSVGGKTAIDLSVGKNLVGAFYQPSLVLCDIEALNTLPKENFLEGCAEIIKYAILYDADLFKHLQAHGTNFDREYVISRCVELKRDVVAQDEFDIGARQKLNYGHTFGHGIELNSDFTISHGKAVAIGMVIAAKSGIQLGLCNQETFQLIAQIIRQFELPTTTDYSAEALSQAALSDKKRFGDHIHLIIPKKIGECVIYRAPVEDLQTIILSGL